MQGILLCRGAGRAMVQGCKRQGHRSLRDRLSVQGILLCRGAGRAMGKGCKRQGKLRRGGTLWVSGCLPTRARCPRASICARL